MIILQDIEQKINELLPLIQDATTQYNDFAARINVIDQTSSTAQAELDAIIAERDAFKASSNLTKVFNDYNTLCTGFIQQGSTESELADLAAIRKPVTDVLGIMQTSIDSFKSTKDKKQSKITTGGPTPAEAKTETPVAAAPTPSGTVTRSSRASTSNTLNSFISQIKKYGVPLSSKFEVELPPMGEFSDLRDINLLCNSSTLPNQQIAITSQKIFGEQQFVGAGTDFGQLQLTFFVNTKFDAHKYFEGWMNMIFNKSERTLGFYRDYARPIYVHVLDKGGNRRYSTAYSYCFPISINSTPVSYDNNHPISLTVTFAYKTWYPVYGQENQFDPELNPLKLNSPSALRAFDNMTLNDAGLSRFDGNGAAASLALGPVMGSNALYAANEAARGVKNLSSLSDGTPVGSLMSKYMNQLGTSSSVIGAGIGDIGSSLGTILAPAQAIAGGVTSMSNVLRSVDNLLGRMGINTNIGKVVGDMNGVAGVIGVVGQLNGIPGALSSLGSVMGSVGGEINNIQRSLVNVPGATKSMTDSIGNLGRVTSDNANITSSIAGMDFNGG